MTVQVLPRLIRHRDAYGYIGVDRNKFDAEVRPYLTEIPLGPKSMAFDRRELDAWADAYIAAHGRPGPHMRKDEICKPGQGESMLTPMAAEPSTRSTKDTASSSASARSARPKRRQNSAGAGPRSKPSNFEAALNACGQMAHGSI